MTEKLSIKETSTKERNKEPSSKERNKESSSKERNKVSSKKETYEITNIIPNEEKLITEFKKTKKEFEESKENIDKYFKKGTEKELQELETAYKKYYAKIDTLKNSDTYNKLTEDTKEKSKKVMKHLQTAIKVFDTKKNEIMKGGGSTSEKKEKIDAVYDYMLQKLFNPEEVKLFKAMRSSSILLLE